MPTRKQIHQRVLREASLPGGHRSDLELRAEAERIPATLLVPDAAAGVEVPGVLLLHGYSADKEMMAGTIGRALLARGIASLALDLPLHGQRRASNLRPTLDSMLELIRHWRSALSEAALGISYLGARAEIDRARLAAVGYSLGSFLTGALAAQDLRVRALVIAAGGDLPPGLGAFARPIVDPVANVRALAGRPLLIAAGRRDRTMRPAQAEALYAAARQPKEIRWYDSGHILPPSAAADVADWLRERL